MTVNWTVLVLFWILEEGQALTCTVCFYLIKKVEATEPKQDRSDAGRAVTCYCLQTFIIYLTGTELQSTVHTRILIILHFETAGGWGGGLLSASDTVIEGTGKAFDSPGRHFAHVGCKDPKR